MAAYGVMERWFSVVPSTLYIKNLVEGPSQVEKYLYIAGERGEGYLVEFMKENVFFRKQVGTSAFGLFSDELERFVRTA